MDWQPITTAPKNREILLWFPAVSPLIGGLVGRWDGKRTKHSPVPTWTCPSIRFADVQFIRNCAPTKWSEVPSTKTATRRVREYKKLIGRDGAVLYCLTLTCGHDQVRPFPRKSTQCYACQHEHQGDRK